MFSYVSTKSTGGIQGGGEDDDEISLSSVMRTSFGVLEWEGNKETAQEEESLRDGQQKRALTRYVEGLLIWCGRQGVC